MFERRNHTLFERRNHALNISKLIGGKSESAIRNENWRKTRPIVEDKSAKGAEKFYSNEEV